MTPYINGMHLTIDVCREVCDKDFYKIKSQPRVCLKVWEHGNWLEERKLEVLRLNKDETIPE